MMSKHIRYIVDDDEYLTCSICDDVFDTEFMTTDDWHFAFNGKVKEDQCNDCYKKGKEE